MCVWLSLELSTTLYTSETSQEPPNASYEVFFEEMPDTLELQREVYVKLLLMNRGIHSRKVTQHSVGWSVLAEWCLGP